MSQQQNEWAEFPTENTLYKLDVVYKKESSTTIANDPLYIIVHYAAYFKNGCWVDANSFEPIITQDAHQISYALWYKV